MKFMKIEPTQISRTPQDVQFVSMSVCYGSVQPPRFVVLDTKSILYLSENKRLLAYAYNL